jgi:hypothetical protein
MTLSRLLGRRLEAWVLVKADALAALTDEGAAALEHSAGRRVYALPHVVAPEAAPAEKERLIFIPGYVDDADGIAAVVQAVLELNLSERWRVVVGASSAEARAAVLRSLDVDQASIVDFLGLVDEAQLFGVYRRARFVVRFRARGGANRLAASSPLIHALAAGCMCITDDDRAGARELERLDLVIRAPEPARRLQQLLVEPEEWRSPDELVRGIDAYSGLEAIVHRYGALLHDIGFWSASADRVSDPVS